MSVLDQGPGIAEEERNLIFQRFWRRDRNKPGSTGLGLSIVQRIAELHSADYHGGKPQADGGMFFAEVYAARRGTDRRCLIRRRHPARRWRRSQRTGPHVG